MATIKEIAAMANVSRTTVSRVLNDSGYVSEEARKRVLKAIEETGYVPSQQAKSLRTKKTKVIGVVIPTIRTETSGRLVSGMDEVLTEDGYQILLANTNLNKEKEIEFINLLKVRQVDGIILAATNSNKALMQQLKQLNLPLVVIGQEIAGVNNVLYDDYHAARDVVSHFISEGHEKIGFIGVDEEDRAVGYLRKQGYLDQMKDSNLPIEQSWMKKAVFNIESGYEAMRDIMENSSETPTAIFAVTDRLAIGVVRYLNEKGFRIPSDIAVMGVGASEMSEYVTPPLTTVDYYYENAGREAAKLLLTSINNQDQQPKKVMLDYRLLKRNSV